MLSQVTLAAIDVQPSDWKGDVLAVLVTEKDLLRSPGSSTFENAVLQRLDGQLGGLLSEATAEEDFAGKSGQSLVLRLQGQGFKRLALIGLGRVAPSTAEACRSIGESVALIAKSARAGTAAVFLASPGGIQEEFKLNATAAIASGACRRCLCSGFFMGKLINLILEWIVFIDFNCRNCPRVA
jgi:leucyl aminopeptidase